MSQCRHCILGTNICMVPTIVLVQSGLISRDSWSTACSLGCAQVLQCAHRQDSLSCFPQAQHWSSYYPYPCCLRKQLSQNNILLHLHLHLHLHEYNRYLRDKYQFNKTTRRRVKRWGYRQLSDWLSETLPNCLFRRRPKKTYLNMMTSNRLDAWAGVEVRSRCPQIRAQLLLRTAQEL